MDYGTRQCEWCGGTYKPARRTSRTCSAECRKKDNSATQNAKMRKPRQTKLCIVCFADYIPSRLDSVYCSRACLKVRKNEIQRAVYIAQKDRRPPRECTQCGKPFSPVSADATRCSMACNAEASYYANRSGRIAYAGAWAKTNPANRQAIARAYQDKRRAWEQPPTGMLGVTTAEWKRILKRHDHKCAYCGSGRSIHMEHVIPLSRGGQHTIGNIVPACASCNLSKNNKLLIEWKRLKLRQ